MVKSNGPFERSVGELQSQGVLVGIKVETEGEGARWPTIRRLAVLTSRVGVPLTVKIGGCDARTDIFESLDIGAAGVVAPMVETPFAVWKFQQALVRCEGPRRDLDARVLIESLTGVNNVRDIVGSAASFVRGVNIGRSDIAASLTLHSNREIKQNSPEVMEAVTEVLSVSALHGLESTIGGRITEESIQLLLKTLPEDLYPSRVETRRMIMAFDKLITEPALLNEVLETERNLARLLAASSARESIDWTEHIAELDSRLTPTLQMPDYP